MLGSEEGTPDRSQGVTEEYASADVDYIDSRTSEQVNPPSRGLIAIKLDPNKMTFADLDVRYKIPELIEKTTNGSVIDSGYDYGDDDTLIVFLSCLSPESEINKVLETLESNVICGDSILACSVIGISSNRRAFRIVHPSSTSGEFVIEGGW